MSDWHIPENIKKKKKKAFVLTALHNIYKNKNAKANKIKYID